MEAANEDTKGIEAVLILLKFNKVITKKKNKGHGATKVYRNNTCNITVRINKRSMSIHAMAPYKYVRTSHQQGLNALRNYIKEHW